MGHLLSRVIMSREEVTAKLQEELSCSICLDCFRDPVSIHCGHNFCRACITMYWGLGKKKSFSCPQCRETSRKKILQPSRELKNIAKIVPELMMKEGGESLCKRYQEGGESVCKRHQEPLKLFCKDDQTPICVVCDKSKEHQGHVVLPMEEAVQDYMEKVQAQLESMRQEKEKLLEFKAMGTARSEESLKTINSEMQKMMSAFEQAQQFLEEQLQLLLTQWKSLQVAAERAQEEYTNRLSADISHLDSLITEAQRRWQQPEMQFLQEPNITLTRFRKRKFHELVENFPELEERLDSLIKQNVVVAQTLQKFEDTLPSELEKGQLESPAHVQTARDTPPFEMEKGESSSPAAKRKRIPYVTAAARNKYFQRKQRPTEYSWESLDFDRCSKIPPAPPSQPGKRLSVGDDVNKRHQEKSFPQCPLS